MRLRIRSKSFQRPKAGRITKVEKQKRGKGINLFLDNAFAFSICQETFLKFVPKADQNLSNKEAQEILDFDQKVRATNQAFNLLGIRPRSRKELEFRLLQKYSPEIAEKVLADLEKKKLILDKDFSNFWTESSTRKLKSRRQIRYELFLKHIDSKTVDETLKQISDKQEVDKAKKLVEKIKDRYKNLSEFERKQKLQSYLARRGYDWETIKSLFN